jgi:hypothetical protein
MMKQLVTGIFLVVLMTGCETTQPAWQQELNDIGSQWRDPKPAQEEKAFKNPRDDFENPVGQCQLR